MATLCNVFLIAIGMSFLVEQVSYGHELFSGSLDEGERQSCPSVNCIGQPACSSDTQCSPNKCCIDLVNSMACCNHGVPPTTTTTTGNPVTSPPTANTTTDSPNPTTHVAELCTDYYGNACPVPGDCKCNGQEDCFTDEICCVEITTDDTVIELHLYCHSTIAPVTTPKPGAKCPIETPPLECAPIHGGETCLVPGPAPGVDDEDNCRPGEICCTLGRDDPPCCVVYPPETFHN